MLKKRKSIILLLIPVITSNSLLFCSRKKEIEPIIFQVSPDKVWSGEDTPIEITGKNFIEGAKLNLKEDKKEATIFSIYLLGDGVKIDIPYLLENEEKIKSIIKKGTPPGDYKIFVEIGNGKKASSPLKVLRLPLPTIEKVSRDKLSNTSEQILILEGKNFQEISKVYIGDREVEFSFSETQIVIKIPPDLPPGEYNIKVVNSEGTPAEFSKISIVQGAKIQYEIKKPQNIFANSSTFVSLIVSNKGGTKVKLNISLKIQNKENHVEIELAPDETKEVLFEVYLPSSEVEFEISIYGEDDFGGKISLSSKDSLIANCSLEICDGKDNDCDGQIDEEVKLTFYRDQDGDGYGDPNIQIQACSQPPGYVNNSDDCDDADPNQKPGAIWLKDFDSDGFTDGTTQISCIRPPGYVLSANIGDCNDLDANINPAKAEICDDIDNNCDGQIDEGVKLTFYKDLDSDGFTDGTSLLACSAPTGYSPYAIAGDCDDSDPFINPGASEVCGNSQDEDCDGNVGKFAYTDSDGDTHAPDSISSCVNTVSFPGQITAEQASSTNDCDDNNPDLNPNTTWFKDADGDGYYPDGGSQVSCSDPYPENSTYVAIPGGDCDDNNPNLNPNTTWFKDADLDGFYPSGGSSVSCSNPFAPSNATYIAIPGNDCNDSDQNIFPGAPLNCNNGQDNDCSGNIETWAYTDADADLFAPNPSSSCVDIVNFPGQITAGYELGTNDCNDNDASIYPGAPLNCNNGQDNDCSGNVETWAYQDIDGDTHAPNSVSSCVDVVSFPGQITVGDQASTNDCDDNNSSIYPGAPLNCNNGQDNDCSGNVETWAYQDFDGDTHAPNSTSSCVDLVSFPGQITVGDQASTNDCNDNNSSIYPEAPEICDGIDNNCDAQIDEGLVGCDIPPCPTSSTAQAFLESSTGDVSITIQWNDIATNEDGFVVEKSKSSDFSSSVSFVIPSNTTSFTLDFEEPLTRFYFRVYAFNSSGNCSPIATTSVFTPPGLLWAYPITGAPVDDHGFTINPKMFDLNSDGKKEIIAADENGYIYAISTHEYSFEISPIILWVTRPGGNVMISTPAVAVYQGQPTVIVANQTNRRIYILDRNGSLKNSINLPQTPYPPIITDFNEDLLPDILVSIGTGGIRAFSFDGSGIFSIPVAGESFFFPAIFEYKSKSTYIVVGTDQEKIKAFLGGTNILEIPLQFTPFAHISTFKIGSSSRAVFSTDDGSLHIMNLVKNPIIKFSTPNIVVAKPAFYDFNNDGTPDIAINSGQNLYLIDGKTGTEICSFDLGSVSYSSPAILTNPVSVIVGTDGGDIFAISPDCTPRWPHPHNELNHQIRSSPLVANIDEDSEIEIVVGTESAAGAKILILTSNGSLENQILSLGSMRSSPKMGDIDGDGIYEIVIGTDGTTLLGSGIYVLSCPTNCASSELKSFLSTSWGGVKTTPLLYDLNDDGFLDIVFAGDNEILYALSGTSIINYSSCSSQPQNCLLWSSELTRVGIISAGAIFPSSPTLFIKSGSPHIAIGSDLRGIYIVDGMNGNIVQNLNVCDRSFSSPATLDYNKDGQADIVIGCDDKKVYFISTTDYSVLKVEGTGNRVRGSPALYDIDLDGNKDIAIGSEDNNLYVFNGEKIHVCSINLGINISTGMAIYDNKILASSNSSSYIIRADDCSTVSSASYPIHPGASFGIYKESGIPRLVFGSGNRFFVSDESFNEIYPFPFTFSDAVKISSPVLGDIEGDGSLEASIAVGSSSGQHRIFTYRITRDVDFEIVWGEFAHDRYNSSFADQKENQHFSPPMRDFIQIPQKEIIDVDVGCSSSFYTNITTIFVSVVIYFIVIRRKFNQKKQGIKEKIKQK